MRLALSRSGHTPKHAAPREPLAPSSRQALAVGLAAALLPLGAAPALADDAPAPTAAAPATVTEPAAATPAAAEAPAAPAAEVPAATVVVARAATTLALSAPAAAGTTRIPVGVRLLAGGHGVRNGLVRLERSTGSGWTYAGRLLTGSAGVGNGTLRVTGATTLRATYVGTTARTPAVSPVRTVRAPKVVAATSRNLRVALVGRTVLSVAARYVGAPYRYGATGPSAFDCSGFTRYVYGKVGVGLPRTSGAQAATTRRVSKSAAIPGDLIAMPGHVGIYAGGGRMYDAPRAGTRVNLRRIYSSNYSVHRVL